MPWSRHPAFPAVLFFCVTEHAWSRSATGALGLCAGRFGRHHGLKTVGFSPAIEQKKYPLISGSVYRIVRKAGGGRRLEAIREIPAETPALDLWGTLAMVILLAEAGWVDVAFGQGLVLLTLAGMGAILGISGVLYRAFRKGGHRSVPVTLGLLAVGSAALIAWCLIGWNSFDFEGLSDHVARNPILLLVVGMPLVMGSVSVLMGAMRPAVRNPQQSA